MPLHGLLAATYGLEDAEAQSPLEAVEEPVLRSSRAAGLGGVAGDDRPPNRAFRRSCTEEPVELGGAGLVVRAPDGSGAE